MSESASGKASSDSTTSGKDSSVECPTCGRTDFESKKGMRQHHKRAHGESIAKATLECDWCGMEFERWKSQLEEETGSFCSPQCHLEDHNKSGSDAPHYRSIPVQCVHCGEGVERRLSRIKRADNIYCSRECADSDHSDRMVNSGNSNYKHGKSDTIRYGSNWEEQREKAIRRDGFECVVCGLPRRESYELYGADLNVHHKTELVKFESTEKANKLDNLETLCHECHPKREHGKI